MWNSQAFLIFLYAAILFGAIVLIRIFQKPFKMLFVLFLNCLAGCSLVLLLNTFFAGLGFQIALNAVTCVLCAFLGPVSPVFLTAFNIFF